MWDERTADGVRSSEPVLRPGSGMGEMRDGVMVGSGGSLSQLMTKECQHEKRNTHEFILY